MNPGTNYWRIRRDLAVGHFADSSVYLLPPASVVVSGGAVKAWIDAITGAAAEVHQSIRSLVLTAAVPLPWGSIALPGVSSVGVESLWAPMTARARAALIAPNCCVRVSAWSSLALVRRISLRSHLLSVL